MNVTVTGLSFTLLEVSRKGETGEHLEEREMRWNTSAHILEAF